jgi:hypothetical protein
MCCLRILPHFADSANRKKKVRDAMWLRTEPVPLQEGEDIRILIHPFYFVSKRK